MADITIDNYEVAEALALTQLIEVFQQLSGGVRREKQMTIEELRDFLQVLFTALTVSGNITQTGGITSLKATTIGTTDTSNNVTLFVKDGTGTTPSINDDTFALFQHNPTADNAYVSLIGDSSFNVGFNFGDQNSEIQGRLLYRNASDEMSFYVNSNEVFRIGSDGALMLGAFINDGANKIQVAGSGIFSGALSVGADTDIACSFGKAKMGYGGVFPGQFLLSYYDSFNTTDTALRLTDSITILNAKTTVSIRNLNDEIINVTGTEISLLKPVTINGATIGTHQLAVSGTCANTAGVWATLSDIRLKTDFSPITDGLEKTLFLAKKIQHFKFKEGINPELGIRTGIVIDDELVEEFSGHINEINPSNEFEGTELGWEYADEEYFEDEGVTEIKEIPKNIIQDGKIIQIFESVEVPVMETIIEQEIQNKKEIIYQDQDFIEINEDGEKIIITRSIPVEVETEELIIVNVEKQVQVMNSIKKTRRIVVKEGLKARQVENSFFQYLFPAVKELNDENIALRAEIEAIKLQLDMEV